MHIWRNLSGNAGKDEGIDKILAELKPLAHSNYPQGYSDTHTLDLSAQNMRELAEKARNARQIVLTGDHAAGLKVVEAVSAGNNNPGLILFDAHFDCQKIYNGDVDWVRQAVLKGLLRPENIIIIGVRSIHPEEFAFVKEHKIRFFSMAQIDEMGISDVCDAVMETARQWGSIIVSFDADVLDPSHAPAVEAIEPGGLTSREALLAARRLTNLKNLCVMEFSEVIPKKDIDNRTSKLVARICFAFIK